MDRITGRNENGELLVNGKVVYAGELYEVASALEEYEDMEEQGKMLILPCKPGDKIYEIGRRLSTCKYGERWGLNCEYGCPYDNYSEKCDCKLEYYIKPQFINSFVDVVCIMGSVGKTVFLTEQEAEKALEGMKNE